MEGEETTREDPRLRTNDCLAAFEEYYTTQNLMPEAEWKACMEVFSLSLPVTFRVVQDTIYSERTKECLEEYKSKCSELGVEFFPLPWYPNKAAYHLEFSRQQLRSMETVRDFHKFLVLLSNSGIVYRQEAVSMIPALFLNVQSDSMVLDMCAAPGSKTSQLVELMSLKSEPLGHGFRKPPTGMVIANDASTKRAHMLIHNLRRLNSPCLVVTNHEAQHFPKCFSTEDGKLLEFDAVLCDVPCTSDGTLRKTHLILKRWNPHLALAFHRLQAQIAKRGIELCKNGGRIVYSTCSLNPIENEAVISTLLRQFHGVLEVIDVSQELPDLRRAQGLTDWKVKWKNEWYSQYDELPDNHSTRKKVLRGMFPPSSTTDEVDVSIRKQLPLCMRFYPHLNNTGGFFVAVLAKHSRSPCPPLSSSSDEDVGGCVSPTILKEAQLIPPPVFYAANVANSAANSLLLDGICENVVEEEEGSSSLASAVGRNVRDTHTFNTDEEEEGDFLDEKTFGSQLLQPNEAPEQMAMKTEGEASVTGTDSSLPPHPRGKRRAESLEVGRSFPQKVSRRKLNGEERLQPPRLSEEGGLLSKSNLKAEPSLSDRLQGGVSLDEKLTAGSLVMEGQRHSRACSEKVEDEFDSVCSKSYAEERKDPVEELLSSNLVSPEKSSFENPPENQLEKPPKTPPENHSENSSLTPSPQEKTPPLGIKARSTRWRYQVDYAPLRTASIPTLSPSSPFSGGLVLFSQLLNKCEINATTLPVDEILDSLFVRQSDALTPLLPRKLWYLSKRASQLVGRYVATTPLKVLYAGCIVMQQAAGTHDYRFMYEAAECLAMYAALELREIRGMGDGVHVELEMQGGGKACANTQGKIGDNAVGGTQGSTRNKGSECEEKTTLEDQPHTHTHEIASSSASNSHIRIVNISTLKQLLDTKEVPPRVNLSDMTTEALSDMMKMRARSPCLLLVEWFDRLIMVPAWRGHTNAELLIGTHCRQLIRWLLMEIPLSEE